MTTRKHLEKRIVEMLDQTFGAGAYIARATHGSDIEETFNLSYIVLSDGDDIFYIQVIGIDAERPMAVLYDHRTRQTRAEHVSSIDEALAFFHSGIRPRSRGHEMK